MVVFRPMLKFLLCIFLSGGLLGSVWAQDTRGSLVPGSRILLMDGTTVKVQDLAVGMQIWTWAPPAPLPVPGKITAIRLQNTDSYLILKAGDKTFSATGSHRIALAGGRQVWLNTVQTGDKVWVWNGTGPDEVPVASVRELPATILAYDLTVEGHRIFQVNGFLVGD